MSGERPSKGAPDWAANRARGNEARLNKILDAKVAGLPSLDPYQAPEPGPLQKAAQALGAVAVLAPGAGVAIPPEIQPPAIIEQNPSFTIPEGVKIVPNDYMTKDGKVKATRLPQRQEKAPPQDRVVEAAATLTDTLSLVTVTPEWIAANPQDIPNSTIVTDVNGNVTKIYAIVNKPKPGSLTGAKVGHPFETHYDTATSKLTENKATTAVALKMENPLSVAASGDGNIVAWGGEKTMRNGNPAIEISYNGGQENKDISSLFNSTGSVTNIDSIDTNVFLVTISDFELGPHTFILRVNPQTQQETATRLTVNEAVRDMKVTNVDNSAKTIQTVYFQYNQAGIKIDNINYMTGVVTTDIIDSVSVNGQPTSPLPNNLVGIGEYVDQVTGELHIKTLDTFLKKLYDINAVKKTATMEVVSNLLDNREIPNYATGSLIAKDVVVGNDANGNRKTYLAGSFKNKNDHEERPIILERESLNFKDVLPTVSATYIEKIRLTKINGQLGLDMLIVGGAQNYGKVFIVINSDNTFGAVYFMDKGYDNTPTEPTPTPTNPPTPPPTETVTPPTVTPTPETPTPSPTVSPSPTTTPSKELRPVQYIPAVFRNFATGISGWLIQPLLKSPKK